MPVDRRAQVPPPSHPGKVPGGHRSPDIAAPDRIHRGPGLRLGDLPLQAQVALLGDLQVGLDELVELRPALS